MSDRSDPENYEDVELKAEVIARALPAPERTDAVIRVEGAWSTWTLLFLVRHTDGWHMRGRLILDDWYWPSKPEVVEYAGHAFVVWKQCVGHGTGVFDQDEVWYTIPDGREAARYTMTRHRFSGTFTPVSYSCEAQRALTSQQARPGFDTTYSVTYDNEGMPRGPEEITPAIPWENVKELFTLRWRDRYEWDESSRTFAWRSSTPFDGWTPAHHGARLELSRGDYEAASLLEHSYQPILAAAARRADVRQWALAIADYDDTPAARRLRSALSKLPAPSLAEGSTPP